jgi:quercetin dioxygenase-like cupin family protein
MTPQDVQKHYFASGLYAKEMLIPAGYAVISHIHAYDHFAFLCKGRAKVTVEEETVEYPPGSIIIIEHGKRHKVVALEDVTWFCVHATNETDVDKIDETLIMGAPHNYAI